MAERYLAQHDPETVAARVRTLILQAMPSGAIDQIEIARSMHQSTSTLQRRSQPACIRGVAAGVGPVHSLSARHRHPDHSGAA